MLSSVALAQGKNVIRLEAIKVEGVSKSHRHSTSYENTLNFESLELKQSFIPKV